MEVVVKLEPCHSLVNYSLCIHTRSVDFKLLFIWEGVKVRSSQSQV